MLILSKHSLFHYLNALNNNCSSLNCFSNIVDLEIYDLPTSRNICFKIISKDKLFFFKQFSPKSKERKGYFEAELYYYEKILPKDESKISELVFKDIESQILIFKSNYPTKSAKFELGELVKKSKINEIKKILIKIAKRLKSLHSSNTTSILNLENKLKFEFTFPNKHVLFEKFIKLWENNSLIHGDLKDGNIFLFGEEANFIDYESLQVGDNYYDLAKFIRFLVFSLTDNFFFVTRKKGYDFRNSIIKNLVDHFLLSYDNEIDFDKVSVFFKVINFDLKLNENFDQSVDFLFKRI